MALYQKITTPDEDTAIATEVARLAKMGEVVTPEQLVLWILDQQLAAWVRQHRDAFNARLRQRFEAATPEKQIQVIALLEAELPPGDASER